MKKLAVGLGILALFAPLAAQDKIPGQRPLLVIEDTFKFLQGSWADYTYFDKVKKESTRINFSILERQTVKNVSYIWMEIEAEMKDTPVVVTRVLVEETKNGPGRAEKAIVQVKGMSPFTVPQKYLQGQDAEVGNFTPAHIVKKLDSQTIQHKGKTISALAVEAENSKGEKFSATISLELPPIAIYQAEDADFRLTANDWGMNAKTKITGTPIPLFLWLIEQISDGLTKKDKK